MEMRGGAEHAGNDPGGLQSGHFADVAGLSVEVNDAHFRLHSLRSSRFS